ncbi:hypothetical protein BDE02_17G057500 [Populus trichocarpa]|nr:hypothetical protein BDE02_17G057500 [Populus trichocarpa]
MFWESEDLGFHFSIQTSLHQLLRRQAVIHCSSFLIHTVQPPSSPFLECLVAKDNSFLLPLAQAGLVDVTLLLRCCCFLFFLLCKHFCRQQWNNYSKCFWNTVINQKKKEKKKRLKSDSEK